MRRSPYAPLTPCSTMRPQGILRGMNRDSPQARDLRWWAPINDPQTVVSTGTLPRRFYGNFPYSDPASRETVTGSLSWVVDSKCAGFGNVLDFPIGGGRLNYDLENGVPFGTMFDGSTNTISITAWVQTDTLSNYRGILSDFNGGLVSMLSSGAGGNPLTYLWPNDASDYNAATGLSFDTTNGEWQLCAIVITPTAGIVYMADAANGLRSFTNTATHNAKDFSVSYGFQVGDDRGNGRFWDGRIIDVRMYQRSLTADDIWQIYDPVSRFDLYKPSNPDARVFAFLDGARWPNPIVRPRAYAPGLAR